MNEEVIQDDVNENDLSSELDAAIAAEEQAEAEARTETPEQREQAAADQQAMMLVGATAINITAKAVKDLWPCLSYDVSTKEAALARVMPLMEKYSIGMPAWLVPWKEEIDAGMFFGGLIVQGFFEVKKHKKAEAEEEKKTVDHNEVNGGFKNGEESE